MINMYLRPTSNIITGSVINSRMHLFPLWSVLSPQVFGTLLDRRPGGSRQAPLAPPKLGGELTAMLVFCIGSPPRPTGSSGRAILGGVRGGKSAYSGGFSIFRTPVAGTPTMGKVYHEMWVRRPTSARLYEGRRGFYFFCQRKTNISSLPNV